MIQLKITDEADMFERVVMEPSEQKFKDVSGLPQITYTGPACSRLAIAFIYTCIMEHASYHMALG